LTITEIEKLFENFCLDKKQIVLNYEQFVSRICEKSINDSRRYLILNVYEALSNLANGKIVDLDLIKSFYNAKAHPLGKEEHEALQEFVECIELFHFSYKNKKSYEITFEEFEEFYLIISFLLDDDKIFENVMKSEWKKVITSTINSMNVNSNMSNNLSNPEYTNKSTKIEERKSTPIQVLVKSEFERTLTPAKSEKRPTTPLTKNLSQNDKEIALAQNQYTKPRTPISNRYDSLELLKQKLKKRGIRGLMNMHKQFLLNCNNLSTISYGDFMKVLKLQRIDLPKDDYDQIFEKFKTQNKTPNSVGISQFLNFSLFIRNFKKVLPNNRLQLVEKAFASLDIERSEMLFIEDIKLKFDGSNHPDVIKKNRYEDDVTMEFLDCFELNYNFLV
jgi:hypothetical protein